MAYGDFAGSILPFPGAQRRDALLELLSTPGLSTDISMPFYNQFMADRASARESRQDYLSQMLAQLLGGAAENQSEMQASMMTEAFQNAYGVKPSSPLIGKVADIQASLYPERRNPLREMPGGVSPMSMTAPVSYEDMLETNQAVKAGVMQGKSLEEIKKGIIDRVMSSFVNPNAPQGAAAETAAAAGGATEPPYIMPENWAAMQGQLNSIIERAYEHYTAGPGAIAPTAPAAPPESQGSFTTGSVGDALKALLGLGTLGGAGYVGLRAAQKFLPYKYPEAPAPTTGGTSTGISSATPYEPYGIAKGYQPGTPAPAPAPTNPAARVGAARQYAIPRTESTYTGPKPITRYYPDEAQMRTQALGNLPTAPPSGLPASEIQRRLGYAPEQARNSLIGMMPFALHQLAWGASGGDELSQEAQLDQLRQDSISLEQSMFADFDFNTLPASLREQIWRDPQTGELMLYMPVGEM